MLKMCVILRHGLHTIVDVYMYVGLQFIDIWCKMNGDFYILCSLHMKESSFKVILKKKWQSEH